MITSKMAAMASNPGAPISSAKPLDGRALGVVVGVLVGAAAVPAPKVGVLVAAAVAAWVWASAAWVSSAFTVAVAGPGVSNGVLLKIGVTGVSVRLEVALGGGDVSVLVDEGVVVKVGLPVGVRVARARAVWVNWDSDGAAARWAGKITRA